MNLTIDCFKLSLEIIVIRYHFKFFLIWLGFFTLCKNLSLYLSFYLFFVNVKNNESFIFSQKFTPDHVHRTGQLRPQWIHIRWFLLRVRGQTVWPLKVTAWCQYQRLSYDHHRIWTDSKCLFVSALYTYNQVSTIFHSNFFSQI